MTILDAFTTSAVATGPAILAQMSAAPNQVMTVLYGGVTIMGALYLGIMLFKAMFPSRQPPIGEDIAKLATKVELSAATDRLQSQIAADIAQHDTIKDTIRREVKEDMVSVRNEVMAGLGVITRQIQDVVKADEERARNAHKRIDVLVTRVSEVCGAMSVIKGGGHD
jgi:hypothetical protein